MMGYSMRELMDERTSGKGRIQIHYGSCRFCHRFMKTPTKFTKEELEARKKIPGIYDN